MTERKDPSPTMMEEGQEGCGGRTEERIPACGVVWKETSESAIHSVLTCGVRPMALKECASAAWSHPQARSAAGWVERAVSRTARTGEQQRRAWPPAGAEDEGPECPEHHHHVPFAADALCRPHPRSGR